MKLREILYKGGVREGSNVVMMPSYYKWENVGVPLTELGATGIFVDHGTDGVLKQARKRFPSFGVVQGDALSFHAYGITAVTHVRGVENYPHGTKVIITERPGRVAIGTVPYDGFEGMVSNAYQIASNFILVSLQGSDIRDEEISTLKEVGFIIIEEGECEDLYYLDRPRDRRFRYVIAHR